MAPKPRDRVEAALAFESTGPPPIGSWGHFFTEEWEPEKLADSTVEAQKQFGWSFVKFQPRATCFAEALGARYEPSGDPTAPPLLISTAESEAGSLEDIRPGSAGHPALEDQLRALRAVRTRLPETPLLQTVFSPLTVAGYLVGKDPVRILQELRERPHVVLRLLNRLSDMLIDFSKRSLEEGADGIFFAISGYASSELMTEQEYRDVVLPYDLKVVREANGWFNVTHLCGEHIHFGLAQDLTPQQNNWAISWAAGATGNPSLAEGIQLSGRPAMGGVDRKTLVSGNVEAVRQEARFAARANDGIGVLIAPDCSVPPEAPFKNLSAMANALSEDGPLAE